MKGQRKYIEETQGLLFLLQKANEAETAAGAAELMRRAVIYALEIKNEYETTTGEL